MSTMKQRREEALASRLKAEEQGDEDYSKYVELPTNIDGSQIVYAGKNRASKRRQPITSVVKGMIGRETYSTLLHGADPTAISHPQMSDQWNNGR